MQQSNNQIPTWAWRIGCLTFASVSAFLVCLAVFGRFDKIDLRLDRIDAVLFIPAIHQQKAER